MQTDQEHEDSANGAVAGVQLTLFPPPKPLLARFGQAFFQRVPPRPGVYLMGGPPDRLLYGFLVLKTQGQRLVLRLARSPEAEPMETLWGALKGSARVAYAALSRLLWTIASQSTSPYEILSVPLHGRLPGRFVVELSPATLEPVCNALASFLSGESDGFLDLVSASLPGRQGVFPFLIRLWDHDMECLREFYRLGPQRNRELRWRFDLAKGVMEQAKLDDLLVICRQEARGEVP